MLIDAHTHLDHYEERLPRALEEIARRRILTLSVSTDPASYASVRHIAGQSPWVVAGFGIHPWYAAEHVDHLETYAELIDEAPFLGEIGLDFRLVKEQSTYPAQRKVLEFFLEAAARRDKIVNLHVLDAGEEVLHLLDRYGIRKSILHWYSGSLDLIPDFAARGAYFSVGVALLFSKQIQAIARAIPEERLLTETDNPGAYSHLAGEPGMPTVLEQVVARLAGERGSTVEALTGSIHRNLMRLVEDDPTLREWLAQPRGESHGVGNLAL
jgi:TatD DNase family protein